jgi:hypothetical protein
VQSTRQVTNDVMSSRSKGVDVRILRSITAGLVALFAATASAQEGIKPADPALRQQQKKADFAEQEKALQSQSRSSASGSPKVEKSAASAAPVSKHASKTEKKAQFHTQEKELQKQSTP